MTAEYADTNHIPVDERKTSASLVYTNRISNTLTSTAIPISDDDTTAAVQRLRPELQRLRTLLQQMYTHSGPFNNDSVDPFLWIEEELFHDDDDEYERQYKMEMLEEELRALNLHPEDDLPTIDDHNDNIFAQSDTDSLPSRTSSQQAREAAAFMNDNELLRDIRYYVEKIRRSREATERRLEAKQDIGLYKQILCSLKCDNVGSDTIRQIMRTELSRVLRADQVNTILGDDNTDPIKDPQHRVQVDTIPDDPIPDDDDHKHVMPSMNRTMRTMPKSTQSASDRTIPAPNRRRPSPHYIAAPPTHTQKKQRRKFKKQQKRRNAAATKQSANRKKAQAVKRKKAAAKKRKRQKAIARQRLSDAKPPTPTTHSERKCDMSCTQILSDDMAHSKSNISPHNFSHHTETHHKYVATHSVFALASDHTENHQKSVDIHSTPTSDTAHHTCTDCNRTFAYRADGEHGADGAWRCEGCRRANNNAVRQQNATISKAISIQKDGIFDDLPPPDRFLILSDYVPPKDHYVPKCPCGCNALIEEPNAKCYCNCAQRERRAQRWLPPAPIGSKIPFCTCRIHAPHCHFAYYVDGRLYDDGVPSDDAYPVDTTMEEVFGRSRRAAMRVLARAGKAQAAKRRQQFLSGEQPDPVVLNARETMEFVTAFYN